MPNRVDLIKEAKFHTHSVVLWPARWQEYIHSDGFSWQVFPFDTGSTQNVPDSPGVYAFCVHPNVAALDARYVMYIGETERSLRTRFREYLDESEDPSGRPRLTDMLLNPYKGFLCFVCAALIPPLLPKEIEKGLLNTFIPPMNTQLPSEVRQIIHAFGN